MQRRLSTDSVVSARLVDGEEMKVMKESKWHAERGTQIFAVLDDDHDPGFPI